MIYKDAESIIIGNLLSDNTTDYVSFLEDIKPEYFTLKKYERIYDVINDLNDRGVKISPESIKLNINNFYQEYADLIDVYDFTLYKEAIRTLKKGYYQKKIREIVSLEMEKLKDDEIKTSDIVLAVNNIVQQLSDFQLVEDNKTHKASDIVIPYLENLEKIKENKEYEGILTGYDSIDDLTCGLRGNQYITIGANSGIGKSSFALNLARNMILAGKGVLIFSLEMSEQQIMNRLISIETNIPLKKFRNKEPLTEQEYKIIGSAIDVYKNANLFINTDMQITTEEIMSYSAQIKKKHNISAIFVDHIGLLGLNEKGEDIRIKLNNASRNLKRLTKELDVPIFVLTQIRKDGGDKYALERPSAGMIKETKSIEEDSDIIMMLHRFIKTETGEIASSADQKKMMVYFDKNRDGALDEIKMYFDTETQRIIDFKNNPITNELKDII